MIVKCTSDTMERLPDYAVVRQTFATALQAGAKRLSMSTCEWDISGSCEDPVHHELFSRPSSQDGISRIDPTTKAPFTVRMQVACRKCRRCLAYRQSLWTGRALNEYQQADRTWFVTLTLTPERHAHCLAVVRKRGHLNGYDFDALAYRAQFVKRWGVISEEITRYVKRVRKASSGPLRLLCVAEHHKSGLPHAHMLVHECVPEATTRRILDGSWRWGFSQARLISDPRQAAYVCKYLSKSGAARVRASERYGNIRSQSIAKESVTFANRSVPK